MRLMQDGETIAGRRRIFFHVWQEDGVTPWAGSVTGKRARLSTSGAAEADSTNDIVRVAGSLHYVELTTTEAAAASPGDRILVRVAAVAGQHLEANAWADVVGDAWYAAAATTNEIADAVLGRDLSAVVGASARSLLAAARALRNRVVIAGGTITVYAEDDTTVAWTGTVSGITAGEINPA
jgi:hypothetical protein